MPSGEFRIAVAGLGFPKKTRSVGARSPVVPFLTPFLGEGSPTEIDYGKKGTLILSFPLEDLA